MMSLGRRIRMLRQHRNITQQAIAEQLGMGRSNFGHIENDRVTPTSADLEKIANILSTTTDYLLGRTESGKFASGLGTYLRAGNPDLSDQEIDDLENELEDYLRYRLERIRQKNAKN